MKKILLVLFVVLLSTFAWGDREISGTVSSNSLYIPGTTMEMEFTLDFTSPDVEWVAFMELTFPAGMTPVGAPADIGTFLFNQIDGQTVSWGAGLGDTSMGYLSGTASPHVFSFEVEIDAGITGNQTMVYHCAGDDYGADPHEFTGDCVIYPALDNDLVAVSIMGNPTPTAGTPSTYTVTVFNQGQNAAAAFDIELFEGAGSSLEVLAATDLAAGATETYDFTFTPVDAGMSVLYASVIWADDQNTDNNMTAELTIDVQTSGTAVVTIGEGTDLQHTVPANYYYMNSLAEQIYYAEELQIGGALTAIDFFYNFADVPTVSDLNIWIGETALTDLSGGYIPSTELTSIHSGPLDYAIGDGFVHIALATPYAYGGGNLVVLVERPMDTEYYSSSDNFYSSTDEVNVARSIYKYSDSIDYDPAVPPTDGTTTGVYANAAFYFVTEGMGAITGTVTSDGNPVADAMVVIDGTASSTTTNAAGEYSFPYVMEGTVSITATKHGFVDANIADVAVVEDETTVADIVMAPLPMVMVSGYVYGSDFPTVGIADAAITLVGYEDYDAVTDANGMYSFAAVFANNEYAISVAAEGYSAYSGTITVADVDLSVADITVLEVANPAVSVVATPNAELTSVDVTWSEPGVGGDIYFEGFEVWPPEGWTFTDADADGYQWDDGGALGLDAHTGVGLAYSASYDNTAGALTPDNWLISPAVSIGGNSTVNYWVAAQDNAWAGEHYGVYISTTGTDPADFTLLFEETMVARNGARREMPKGTRVQGTWYERTVDLAGYGGECYIGFRHFDSTDMFYLDFDDVTIGAPMGRNTISDQKIVSADRALETYKIYRMLLADQGTPENWTMLAEDLTVLNYTDADFATVADGVYKYAVVAVYTNDNEAAASFSNPVEKGVSGTATFIVMGNDGNPIEDANISFTATDGDPEHDYDATTDAAGNAIIGNVWYATYDLNVSAAGFVAYEDMGIVFSEDATINVTLNEVTNAPSNLTVSDIGDNTATIMWEEPGAGAAAEFRYDDGIATAQLGFGDNPYSVMGGSHFHSAIISEVTWLLTSNAVHTEAVLYIFGLDAAGIPDTGQLLHESTPQPNVDDSWNTYVLPTPVDAPNGFFVGVCTPNIFTAIGTDDGVGDPYVFTEGNQMGIADWTAGNDWLDVGPAGFPFNFTVRALGTDLGELTFAPREPLTGNGTENITYSRLETPIAETTNTRSLTGYKVYLDGAYVAATGADEMIYAFTGLDLGTVYEAGVTAVYTGDIESDMVTIEFDTTEDGGDIAPAVTTKLGVNYPNPFNPVTNIRFSLKNSEDVSVQVYNVRGELVNTLVNERLDAGDHNVVWEGYDNNLRPCASGVYFYKMKAGRYTSTKKMILMK